MNDNVLVAVIAFASAVAGGVLQASFSYYQARAVSVRQQKIDAYSSYFKGIGILSHPLSADDTTKAYMLISESRGKIALYGSKEVLIAMANAFRCGPIVAKDFMVHARMIRAMRQDVQTSIDISDDRVLFEMLYGNVERFEN